MKIVRALEGDTSIEDLSKGGRARGMTRARTTKHFNFKNLSYFSRSKQDPEINTIVSLKKFCEKMVLIYRLLGLQVRRTALTTWMFFVFLH